MNNEQQQIIDEVYESALIEYGWESLPSTPEGWFETIEHFIHKCKMDNEFYEKWGLKIEERELSIDERQSIYENEYTNGIKVQNDHWLESKLKTRNIPTKLITVIYNNEKIESYEYKDKI